MEWIKVEDELPEMYKRVLVKGDSYLVAGRQPKTEYEEDWGIDGDWMWSIVNDCWCNHYNITHWMPLPPSPKD